MYPETARFQPVSLQNIFDFSDHWVHPFYEVAREIETVASHLQTNRTVNSTWECRDYNVIGSGDGLSTNITYNDEGREVSFDVRITAPNATTYITDTNITCGARCARVWAFQTMYVDNSTAQLSGARLYDCNITVSEVDNAYMAEHQLGDEQARIAAGAIARSPNSNDGTSLQWNLYPGKCVEQLAICDYVGEFANHNLCLAPTGQTSVALLTRSAGSLLALQLG